MLNLLARLARVLVPETRHYYASLVNKGEIKIVAIQDYKKSNYVKGIRLAVKEINSSQEKHPSNIPGGLFITSDSSKLAKSPFHRLQDILPAPHCSLITALHVASSFQTFHQKDGT